MIDVRYINLARRSDRRRFMERQLRFQGLEASRVDALGPDDGRRLLPKSPALASEIGLLATWDTILRDVVTNGSRNGARWLLVLEDDAMLVPFFQRRALDALEAVPDGCDIVQLGALTRYTMYRHRVLWRNIVLAVAYVLGGSWTRRARLAGGGDDPTFSTDLRMGAHATAVRVSAIQSVLELLEPYDHAIDVIFANLATEQSGRVLRHRRQLAFQGPLFTSDIEPERNARAEKRGRSVLDVRYINLPQRTDRRRWVELQLRIQQIDAERIEALGPDAAECVLPQAAVLPTEKGLLASWVVTLRDVAENGARHGAAWVILLEDDVLLMPFFRQQALSATRRVARTCGVLQLGGITRYSWRREHGLARFVGRCIKRTALYVVHGAWRPSVRARGGGSDPAFSTELIFGTHAIAIRVSTIPHLLELLEPYEVEADVLLMRRSRSHPGFFMRNRRQLAVQAPFASDILPDRLARDQRNRQTG